MTARRIGFFFVLGTLAGQPLAVTANAADFTCNVYGGSFLLDDSDFKAIKDTGVTKEKFASISAIASARAASFGGSSEMGKRRPVIFASTTRNTMHCASMIPS